MTALRGGAGTGEHRGGDGRRRREGTERGVGEGVLRRPRLGLPSEGHRAGGPAIVGEAGGGVRDGAFPRQEPREELAILLDLEGIWMVPRVKAAIHHFLVFLFGKVKKGLFFSDVWGWLSGSCKI